MVTSSDDDANPVILMWDLRNASAPEKTLSGHTKGVLCVDWCPKDSDLLLSCGKDNRTIVWNATHGQVIGDLVHTSNWAFESKWCPRNPDLTVVASFDGKIGIHSISNAEPLESLQSAVPATPLDPNDPFAMVTQPETPLYQEPVNFVLVQPPKWFRRPVGASWGFGGKRVSFSQGTSVSIKCVSLDPELSARIDSLEVCLASESLEACSEYCKARAAISSGPDKDIWLFLNTTFSANSQADMLSFLGLDPGFSSDDRLQALMAKLNIAATTPDAHQVAPNDSKAQFSLFHTGKTTEEHDVDNLITKAIISGDFESAVNICLATNRLADALVLALNGGEELLQKAQDEFFKRTSKTRSYIRVLKSIVEQDLSDLVSNIKIEGQGGWREVLALICSFSKPENFAGYFEMFGQRLEGVPSAADRGGELRNHAASMCYIGSANVEKVISLWSVALSLQKQQVASTARSSPSSSILMNQSFVERVQLFFHSIGFVDPELSFVPEEGASFALAPLYTSLAKHAQAAALQGKAYAAWRALEQIPPAFDDIEALDVLRDRVYQSLGKKLGVSGLDPVFPYEVVDVVDIEAQQQLLLQSQGESNRQAASQYGYGAGQPPAFGRQGYQALPQNNAYGAPQGAFGAQSYQQGQYGAPSFQPPRIDTTLQGNYKAAPPFGQPAAAPNYGQSAPAPSFAQPAAAPVVPPFANSSFVQQAPALFQPPSFNAPNIPQYGASANAGPRAVGPPPSTQASQPPPPIPAVADRSKISPKDKPVYLSIKKHWDAYSKTVNVSSLLIQSTEKSDIQEAEKRLELLYDQMNSQQVPAPVIDLLSQLGRGIF